MAESSELRLKEFLAFDWSDNETKDSSDVPRPKRKHTQPRPKQPQAQPRPLSPAAKKQHSQPRPTSPAPKKQHFQTVSSKELEQLSTVKQPKNTEYSTKWALKNFTDWKTERNAAFADTPVPDKLLETASPEDLNKWLSFYVAETRTAKGDFYPPSTLYQLLCGILRHMRIVNPHAPDFLNKEKPFINTISR